MTNYTAKTIKINVSETIGDITGLFISPDNASHLLVLGHGAGADMRHAFMELLSQNLAAVGIATLRYNFPYMEKEKRGRPDSPKVAHPSILAAINKGIELAKDLPVLVGGKSFGGRMTSQVAAEPGIKVDGIIYFGFPLHAPGKPSTHRADHLKAITNPMLFLQGTRDTLAQNDLIKEVCDGLSNTQMVVLEGADHSFKMLKRSGITHEEMVERLAKEVRSWLDKV